MPHYLKLIGFTVLLSSSSDFLVNSSNAEEASGAKSKDEEEQKRKEEERKEAERKEAERKRREEEQKKTLIEKVIEALSDAGANAGRSMKRGGKKK